MSNKKAVAWLEMALIGGAVIATVILVTGCQGISGFQYANNTAGLSSSEARNAAAMARAEATALEAIANETDASMHRVIDTASGLADELGAGGVGAILGALSTLWVKPPRRRKKTGESEAIG